MASVIEIVPGKWRVQVRLKGHKPVTRTFTSEVAARAFGDKTEKALQSGQTLKPGGRGMTVAEAVQKFREFRELGDRPITSTATEHYYLNHLADPDGIGEIEVDRLTTAMLVRWCRDRADEGAGPSTMGSELSKLGTVLKYVAAATNSAPCQIVEIARPVLVYNGLVGPSQHRERRPTQDELLALRGYMQPLLWDLVLAAIATGMRRGELARILWDDLDVERKRVLVRDRKHPRKKAGNHIMVPLTSYSGIDALDVLQRQPKVDARVFPVTTEWISDEFGEACKALKIDDLFFHDMRHEATSRFFEAGLQIQQVAVLTGHKNWANLRRYTQIRQESLPDLGTGPGTQQHLDSLRI